MHSGSMTAATLSLPRSGLGTPECQPQMVAAMGLFVTFKSKFRNVRLFSVPVFRDGGVSLIR